MRTAWIVPLKPTLLTRCASCARLCVATRQSVQKKLAGALARWILANQTFATAAAQNKTEAAFASPLPVASKIHWSPCLAVARTCVGFPISALAILAVDSLRRMLAAGITHTFVGVSQSLCAQRSVAIGVAAEEEEEVVIPKPLPPHLPTQRPRWPLLPTPVTQQIHWYVWRSPSEIARTAPR